MEVLSAEKNLNFDIYNAFEYEENENDNYELSTVDLLEQIINNPNIINYSYIQEKLKFIIKEMKHQ
jgi:hypothetical protein